jgi:hypothetical protein
MDPLTVQSRDGLLAALTQRHRDLLRPGESFELSTQETPRGVRGVIALHGGADGTRTELEARVDLKRAKLDGEEALALVLDALDLTLGEYLESGRSERLNAAFEEQELEGRPVSLRGRVRHPALEAEANKLLGETPPDDWAD